MHLGEIKFKKKSGKDDQAQPDGTEAGGNIAKLLGTYQNHAFFMMSYSPLYIIKQTIRRKIILSSFYRD